MHKIQKILNLKANNDNYAICFNDLMSENRTRMHSKVQVFRMLK